MSAIADDLRAWRERLELSQEQAAALLGVPLATFRNYEQGRSQPQHAQTLRLAMGMVEHQRRRRLVAS